MFDAIDGGARSIRNRRRRALIDAFGAFAPVIIEVEDYGFRHALRVFEEARDADLYVVLSDSIAVALKHLLIAAGLDWQGRVIGFDDSELARRERLPSFGQDLEAIGERVIGAVIDATAPDGQDCGPFQETLGSVRLCVRH